MTTFQRAYQLAQDHFASSSSAVRTVFEFGVFQGDTYSWMAEQVIAKHPYTVLVGFDSWQGLPPESDGVWRPDRHAQGQFSTTKDVVLRRVPQNDPRFQFVDGFFDQSLTPELRERFSNLIFVNIDVDLHLSTIQLLDWIKPLLRPGVVLYFDDWKDPQDKFSGKWGEHLAWEQWTQNNPDVVWREVEVNEWNQRTLQIMAIMEQK